MISLIEKIIKRKKYMEETFYLAVSICDRYLFFIISEKIELPCLVTLIVTAIFLAAKIEQPLSPNLNKMIHLAYNKLKVDISRSKIIDLEWSIISALDFSLRYTSPLMFLSRLLRLQNLDSYSKDPSAETVDIKARIFCRTLLRSKAYLTMKPS